MALHRILASVLLLPALAVPALAQDTPAPAAAPTTSVQSAITLTLGSSTEAEKRVIVYTCEGDDAFSTEPFAVEYINAVPNFLALVPIDGKTMIFTAVIAASGVRYVAGEYEWWTKGAEGTLRNLIDGEDAAPTASCLEFTNTP